MADIYVKRNDRKPIVESVLGDRNGPVNLTGATVKFIMQDPSSGAVKINTAATIVDAVAGSVSYSWVVGDTDTASTYRQEWEVTFVDGKKETFPNDDYNRVIVTEDLA